MSKPYFIVRINEYVVYETASPLSAFDRYSDALFENRLDIISCSYIKNGIEYEIAREGDMNAKAKIL